METITDFPGAPCLELLQLQRLKPDLWRFQFREQASASARRLVALLFSFRLHFALFNCTVDVSVPWPWENWHVWLINSQGMWLLSHLFVNWQEMYQKACPLVVEASPSVTPGLITNGPRVISPRHFQILKKHREEWRAKALAEAVLADLYERYPGQITCLRRDVLRELFAAEGLVGYVINGEIEAKERLVVLPDGSCMSYEEWYPPDETGVPPLS